MFTLRNAINMRLEDIQEEKRHLREMIEQLTKEQHELIGRLERMEQKSENPEISNIVKELAKTDDDLKGMSPDIPADLLIEKTTNQFKDSFSTEALRNEYVLPTDPVAFSQDRSKSMSYKELTQILINYAKEHQNQVDHEKFEKYLIDHYRFEPENFSQIIWRARKEDSRLRSLISGNRKITILDISGTE
ncbi:hypothetical protein [Halobacillus sp. BBL2006]|uniref:hypothetical protein n=1 Tax=Halobacillus sp. BBL2006 TaxID=1543706 RepID=UPI000541FB6E|nr:hypothetical protein [Halobacillus sp. BBL2006]KHE72960.1 hypothetical protein LD39_01840 [Halobacillus sp. BBL2006]